jgi:hypothetical protein
MTEKEFYKFRKEALVFYLSRCLENNLINNKLSKNKNLNVLSSLFGAAIDIAFKKGQLSAYEDCKKTFKDKFLKNFGVRI